MLKGYAKGELNLIFKNIETKNIIHAIALHNKNINNSLSVVLLKEIGDSYVYQTNQEFLLKKERV